ncbi:MAG: magnesium/cobalt transporter CorA [Deltaproteobacteria bacterium]|jgi:magnesium transporter|nr:magnesium/cobalt transporter CorA [Deltaproteobacteria bacterium]
MPKFIKKRSKKAGLPPGTLVHIGEKMSERTKITVFEFDELSFQEREPENLGECFLFKKEPTVTWVNVHGVHEVEILEKFGNCFGLHPLVMEDILNTDQRPKIENYGEDLFIVLKMLSYDEKKGEISAEQVSLVLRSNAVLSFTEKEKGAFTPIQERLRSGKGRLRKMGADYLAYTLLDIIVDHYFAILEKLSEKIEELEEKLVTNPTTPILQKIQNLKREMIFLRKWVWPLREVISSLERGESSWIQEGTRFYLRDVYDHTIQVMDTVETFREVLSGMMDIYLSSINNRMNAVMKVLTIIATIFMPLTFLAGVYGMNFKHMPELEWQWGYPLLWVFMILIAVFMLISFRKKKWL